MASKGNTGIVRIILSGLYKNVLKNIPFNFAMSVHLPDVITSELPQNNDVMEFDEFCYCYKNVPIWGKSG
jgi:hypothetical protein